MRPWVYSSSPPTRRQIGRMLIPNEFAEPKTRRVTSSKGRGEENGNLSRFSLIGCTDFLGYLLQVNKIYPIPLP